MVVYLVGAGPGDPELITIKGQRLLSDADAIVYDRLTHPSLLEYAKPGCLKFFAGKKLNHHYMTQDETNELLVKLGSQYDVVVRLKGGDPFVFGRGGEEAEFLVKAGISFHVIPGISSVIAVPAYAGIPVTHRSYNSQLSIVTGRESEYNSDIVDFEKYPPVSVILMGSTNRKEITRKLLNSKQYNSSTPVAIITNGTLLNQRVVKTTIVDLEKAAIETPALIVVGEVVNLRNKLNWFDTIRNQSYEKKIVIPRSSRQNDRSKRSDLWLKNLGIDIEYIPFLKFEIKNFILPDLNDYDVIVFTSKKGVEIICERYQGNPLPKGPKYFTIGPTTQKKLKEKGIVSTHPTRFTSIALGKLILEQLEKDKHTKILILRSENATPDLRTMLLEFFTVKEISIYKVIPRKISTDELEGTNFIFITAGTVAKALNPIVRQIRDKKIGLVSIGPITSQMIRAIGLKPVVEAQTHTIKGMGYSLIDYLSNLGFTRT